MIATSSTTTVTGPQRTCVGCRQVVAQGQLLRLAVVDERVVPDPRRRAPGRGVYVHARPDCLKAAGKGGLARSLKRGVSRPELDAIASVAATAAASQGGADAVERARHPMLPVGSSVPTVSPTPPDVSLTSDPAAAGTEGQFDPSDRTSHGAYGA